MGSILAQAQADGVVVSEEVVTDAATRTIYHNHARSNTIKKATDSVDRPNSPAVELRLPAGTNYEFYQVLQAFAAFVKRGNLGYLDANFLLSWKSSNLPGPVQVELSLILPEALGREPFSQHGNKVLETPGDLGSGVELDARLSADTTQDALFSVLIVLNHSILKLELVHMPNEYTRHFGQLLLQILADMISLSGNSGQIDRYELQDVTQTELHTIWDWSSQVPELIDRTIFSYLQEHAANHPETAAVSSWDTQFTYAEVDQLSTKLAHELISEGVRAGVKVPLLFTKSAWTVIAVLAVMKAGAAFVLTDPSQPESRLTTIVAEVDADLLLCSTCYFGLSERIAPRARIMAIGPDWRCDLKRRNRDPLPPVPASELMYVIFTSGSTGKPKGVMISHSNYTSGAIPRASIIGYGPETRVLDFASYAFDVSIDCMLLTLATGGCICVPSVDDRVNNLSGAIRKMHVNMVHTTPSIARVFDSDVIPSLTILGLGGEAVPAHEAARWNEQTKVVVAYGPSECTVGCTFEPWNQHKTYTSLGRGCGCVLWIVDPNDHNKLAPIGALGELLVEGPIVGSGYLDEPEKTAAAFIDEPTWLINGSSSHVGRTGRLYKTGDLVRYDADASGAVVFAGRKDDQVKIRGQRVELEEVEYHLRTRLLENTAVIAEVIRPSGDGNPLLAAFVVENDMKQEQIEYDVCNFSDSFCVCLKSVEEELRKSVPRYMIPATFIPLTQMPMSVSGKTDRKRLRDTAAQLSRKQLSLWRRGGLFDDVSRALTENENLVNSLWKEVLRYEGDLGPQESFFNIGGDSLQAMRLVAAARKVGYRLTIADIFTRPTLETMAAQLTEMVDEFEAEIPAFSLLEDNTNPKDVVREAAALCGVVESDIEDVYPCTPLQEALMALSTKIPEAYIAQRVVSLSNKSAASRFKEAFDVASMWCPILRTRIVYTSSHGLVQVLLRPTLAPEIVPDLKAYLEEDRRSPMVLGSPLCRIAFVEKEELRVECVMTMHHALYDGWSMPLIVDRLNRAYYALDQPCRQSFKKAIKALKASDNGASKEFWMQLLEGVPGVQFPALPYPEYQTAPNSLHERYIQVPIRKSTSHTLATVIRGAWAYVAAEYTGNSDIVFGETLTGRNMAVPGIEEIEAPLITTVPYRIKVVDVSTAQYLTSVHEENVKRMPHEHIGLQNIRQLNEDTRRACELRTGLVLHPCDRDADNKLVRGPADGFVPVDDREAAKEALKFNSYALMLVCTMEKDGFLVMASFDSNCVKSDTMQRLLQRFDEVVQFLYSGDRQSLIDTLRLAPYEKRPHPGSGRHNDPVQTEWLKMSELVVENKHEQKLTQIWSRVLKIDEKDITSDDNFFDLGGDSISAMKLVSELKKSRLSLTVAQVFSHRQLRPMARQIDELEVTKQHRQGRTSTPKQSVCKDEPAQRLLSRLPKNSGRVVSTYKARPLQHIAVRGTVHVPRFSVRYDMCFRSETINKEALHKACRELVRRNEILRTTFIEDQDQSLAIVLDELEPSFETFEVDGDVEAFSRDLCDLDIRTRILAGSSFVKFFLIQSSTHSCLVFRISHAQYDELCLPLMLEQLGQLYAGCGVAESYPFSDYVQHVQGIMPHCQKYWSDLLSGSVISRLHGPCEVKDSKALVSITKSIDVRARPSNITLGSYPTAAWALCLSRRLKQKDVVFGEVVSGRGTGFPQAEHVAGPCWQYSPVRVSVDGTGNDLLIAVQNQHVESLQYQAMAFEEIVGQCTNWDNAPWFDSVVHQAIRPMHCLPGIADRIETYYPSAEPLKEWKIQTFAAQDELGLEIITFAEWRAFGQALLDDLVAALERLLHQPADTLQTPSQAD